MSAGWASLYVLCDVAVQAFPVQWRATLAACIAIGGLYRPVVAYAMFTAAIAYPLYMVSVYLMALALAALILSWLVAARLSVGSGGGGARSVRTHGHDMWCRMALLIVAAPLVASVHLAPVLPLLAGLWWGGTGGAIVGGMAALWLKVCAGIAGSPIDLWQVSGWSVGSALAALYERFHTANSLQTLVWLARPLVEDRLGVVDASLMLLFNLLQVIAWAAAGYAVGALALRTRSLAIYRAASGCKQRLKSLLREVAASATLLSLGPGLWLIWAGYVAVPSWLQIEGPRWFVPRSLPAQVVWAGAVAWALDSLVQYLRRPVIAAVHVRGDRRPWFPATNQTSNVKRQTSGVKRHANARVRPSSTRPIRGGTVSQSPDRQDVPPQRACPFDNGHPSALRAGSEHRADRVRRQVPPSPDGRRDAGRDGDGDQAFQADKSAESTSNGDGIIQLELD